MSDWLETFKLASTGLSLYMVFAFFPGRGFLRSILLARKSKMWPLDVRTARMEQMKELKQFVESNKQSKSILLVMGPQGVGKSCLIQSATEHVGGTVDISVHNSQTSKEIEKESLYAISGFHTRLVDPTECAARVCRMYRFMFGRPLTLLIRMGERCSHELEYAARRLTREHGVRVIMDVLPNSFEPVVFYPSETKVPTSSLLLKVPNVTRLCL